MKTKPDRIQTDIEKLAEFTCVKGIGCTRCSMLSGAGHDAMIMARICPVAMIFVPSHNSASHVPEEWTEYADLQKGIEVLCETLRKMSS